MNKTLIEVKMEGHICDKCMQAILVGEKAIKSMPNKKRANYVNGEVVPHYAHVTCTKPPPVREKHGKKAESALG